MIRKLKKNILQLLIIIALVYFTVVVSIYFYQRNLLYHPNENNYSGDKLTVDVENVKVAKKMPFHAWEVSYKNPVGSSHFGMLETPDLAKFGRSD